jgi:hypothetical protein
LVLYVDDLIMTGPKNLIVGCKSDLVIEFEMKDTGLMHYFMGLDVWQIERDLPRTREVHSGDPEEIQDG